MICGRVLEIENRFSYAKNVALIAKPTVGEARHDV